MTECCNGNGRPQWEMPKILRLAKSFSTDLIMKSATSAYGILKPNRSAGRYRERLHFVRDRRSGFGRGAGFPFWQEIDRAMVGDSEQPRLQGPAIIELVELPVGFEQSLLHDVFAVHD
jgi:hypothetical protein